MASAMPVTSDSSTVRLWDIISPAPRLDFWRINGGLYPRLRNIALMVGYKGIEACRGGFIHKECHTARHGIKTRPHPSLTPHRFANSFPRLGHIHSVQPPAQPPPPPITDAKTPTPNNLLRKSVGFCLNSNAGTAYALTSRRLFPCGSLIC